MNPPLNNESSNLNLPPPMPAEQHPEAANGAAVGSPESNVGAVEHAPSTQGPAAGTVPPVAAPAPMQQAAPAPQVDDINTSSAVVPSTADDTDLIEKEWVVKAKQIISKTQYDPYNQSKEIGLFKADYMKKRYNKTIDVSD